MAQQFNARFYDGLSAVARSAVVHFGATALTIELSDQQLRWHYGDIVVRDTSDNECRLGLRTDQDAILVLPPDALALLRDVAPDDHGHAAGRRRMGNAIAWMVGAAALIAAILFIGVPAASGPLARATPKDFEVTIGANMAAQIQTVFRRCGDPESTERINAVLGDMAERGNVGMPVNFAFVRTSAPNAFALPGGEVMATSGLLTALDNDQEAFFAVMAHELGHVKGRDGLRALYRNAGLGIILEIITGGSGLAQQAVLLGGQLTQLRHTREQESAADEAAYEIMAASNLDPAALARAFEAITFSLRDSEGDDAESDQKAPNWFKTHPDTQGRIEAARAEAAPAGALPLSDEEWATITDTCNRRNDD